MPPPSKVKLGHLSRSVVKIAVWRESDPFPAHQAWADEFERILEFLEAQGQFERFRRRLCARERDGALAEARAGFFLHRNGFRILNWEPDTVIGRPGDIEVLWRDTEPVFVEVKSSSWEGELTREEISSGRKERGKYVDGEARSDDPGERVIYAVRKALPKLSPKRVNLVVVVDDLFVSPLERPIDLVCGPLKRALGQPDYAAVSGVLLLNAVAYGDDAEYRMVIVPGMGRSLPESVRVALRV